MVVPDRRRQWLLAMGSGLKVAAGAFAVSSGAAPRDLRRAWRASGASDRWGFDSKHYLHRFIFVDKMLTVMPAKSPSLYPGQSRQMRALGLRLREARLRRRLTVAQVAERAAVSRPTLNKVEQGDPSVTAGTYLRVLTVLGLESDLDRVAAEDPVGRRLQDAELSVPRRAPKRKPNPPGDQDLDGGAHGGTQ
jgi:transcriptional regulator with XRE-family HTH domain